MNAAQKTVREVIESYSHHNGGLHDAYDKLASITLADFVTLDAVPTVEWVGKETDYGHNWTTPQDNCWEVYDIDPGTPDHQCNAVNDDGFTNKSFTAIDHAKRYVEIKIHLAAIERKLLAELAKT